MGQGQLVTVGLAATMLLGARGAAAGTVGVLAFDGSGELISASVLEKLTTMVATEVDITGQFEFTTQYLPGEFPSGCAASTACMARFSTDMEHDRLIIGTVNDGTRPDHVAMRLRLFDPSTSTFERTVSQEILAARDTINNDIPPLVMELLTGERPKSAAEILAEQQAEDDIHLDLSLDEVALEQDEEDVFVFGEEKPADLSVTDLEFRATDALLDTGPLEAERERLRVLAKVLRMEREERLAARRARRGGTSSPQLQEPNTTATDAAGGEPAAIVIEDGGGGVITIGDEAAEQPGGTGAEATADPAAAEGETEPAAAGEDDGGEPGEPAAAGEDDGGEPGEPAAAGEDDGGESGEPDNPWSR